QFADILLPARVDILAMAAIRTHAEYAADMIEDDGGVREGACEIGRIGQLRMVLPGLEAQPEPGELCEPLTEFGIARQARRNDAGGEFADCLAGVPGHAIADA